MKNLEKIFNEHREIFDDQEPQEEHFEHFLSKLNTSKETKKSFWYHNYLKIAAIIVFVFLSGVIGYQIKEMQNKHISLSTISPEFEELETYYTNNINDQLSIIHQLGNNDKQQNKILAEELNDMDQRYNQLKKELSVHPDDDRIIDAMIEYYQVKTDILNRIISQLHQIRKQSKSYINVSA